MRAEPSFLAQEYDLRVLNIRKLNIGLASN